MAEYKLEIIRPSDSALRVLATDFLSLEYTRKVNHYGILKAKFSTDSQIAANLGKWYEVELWRRDLDNGIDWYRTWEGFITRKHYTYKEVPYLEITAKESEWLLSKRVVGQTAEREDRTLFSNQYANVIFSKLIYYNAAGQLDDRSFFGTLILPDRGFATDGIGSGVVPYELPSAPPASTGNQITFRCFGLQLYEAIQKLCETGGGDFDLYKGVTGGLNYWTARFYPGQLGTDRTATITFSLTNGNMDVPEYVEDDSEEENAIGVGGQGEGSERSYEVVNGSGLGTDPRAEGFVNGSSEDTSAALQTIGENRLTEKETIKDFRFNVIQNLGTQYDVHYFLGDKVSAVNPFTGTTSNWKIDSVAVSLHSDGKETINVGVMPA